MPLSHLQFLKELGVAGFSRDPAWTARRVARVAPPVPGEAESEPAMTGSPREPEVVPFGLPSRVPAHGADASDDAEGALTALRAEIGDCTRCKLHTLGRSQVVFGVGNPRADLMFAGEAPGQDEDRQGVPFVGRAGQLLTKIIEAMGMRREDVYIANVIKCRPPGNRNPEPDEVATCEPFLFRQIAIVKPKVIVALGTFATRTLLQTNEPISRLRGRAYEFRGASLVPTFHPAFLLRSPQFKRETWEDMKMVMELLKKGSGL
ncbi:MAG: uracil-DNA glycosylase family protein [Vicinamibacterales bacterium]